MIPTMLKVQDEDGEIRTVRQINVWLICYKEENRWALVFRQE